MSTPAVSTTSIRTGKPASFEGETPSKELSVRLTAPRCCSQDRLNRILTGQGAAGPLRPPAAVIGFGFPSFRIY